MNTSNHYYTLRKVCIFLCISVFLTGCNLRTQLSEIGKQPAMSRIVNPLEEKGYKPIIMPMPKAEIMTSHPNSLWRTGAQTFLWDQRAKKVGDLVTVTIEINDTANVANKTSKSRSNTRGIGVSDILGIESKLPDIIKPTNLIGTNSNLSDNGNGNITRKDNVSLTLAATIVQVLPNGNMVIYGKQEMRVNFEVREVAIAGIIRPEDITETNTITHQKIAEARISYGGRGQITNVQQPNYGNQLIDILMPF